MVRVNMRDRAPNGKSKWDDLMPKIDAFMKSGHNAEEAKERWGISATTLADKLREYRKKIKP